MSVFVDMCGGRAAIIQDQDLGSDKCAVVSIGQGKDTQSSQHHWKSIHRGLLTSFAAFFSRGGR